jgi:hypothetical protein
MVDVKTFIVVAISLAIGVFVFYNVIGNVETAVDDGNDNVTSDSEQTISDIKTNFGNGFTLLAILGIVLAAVWLMRALNLF